VGDTQTQALEVTSDTQTTQDAQAREMQEQRICDHLTNLDIPEDELKELVELLKTVKEKEILDLVKLIKSFEHGEKEIKDKVEDFKRRYKGTPESFWHHYTISPCEGGNKILALVLALEYFKALEDIARRLLKQRLFDKV
jgi:tyrosyl-tRNA synthetase